MDSGSVDLWCVKVVYDLCSYASILLETVSRPGVANLSFIRLLYVMP